MKTRESGMPDGGIWESFFSTDRVLHELGLHADSGDVVDFGCGYGTFTIPAAKLVRSTVHAIDIEPQMVHATEARAHAEGLQNIRVSLRDFVTLGSGLPTSSVGYAMLFNILHCEDPVALIGEARRVLVRGGLLAIMHWNHDSKTPRGPSMEIRPRPKQCRQWAEGAGFRATTPHVIDLPPYHYGVVLMKA